MMKDNEIAGAGNWYTAQFGEYNPRTGIRANRDPKPNPSVSPYAMYEGNPIRYSDVLLDSVGFVIDKEGASGTPTGLSIRPALV